MAFSYGQEKIEICPTHFPEKLIKDGTAISVHLQNDSTKWPTAKSDQTLGLNLYSSGFAQTSYYIEPVQHRMRSKCNWLRRNILHGEG